jgi:hypothetical protein
MNTSEILSHIDSQIARLKEARNLLAGQDGHRATSAPKHAGARFMSAEARKRIGDAQRKRWAKQRAAKKAD